MYNQIYHLSHTVNKLYPFMIHHFFKYKNYFQGFFLPDDYSLDIKTLQQQQSQDPVLRTVYSWLLNNEKPEFITPLITGTPFLHVYYKRFSQLFIDESTNLISLYITNPTVNNPILYSKFLYKILFAYAYLFDYLKLSLTNFMNILTLV